MAERAPEPGELCSCGRQAVTVYLTEKFGPVGYCGISNASPLPGYPKPPAPSTEVAS